MHCTKYTQAYLYRPSFEVYSLITGSGMQKTNLSISTEVSPPDARSPPFGARNAGGIVCTFETTIIWQLIFIG